MTKVCKNCGNEYTGRRFGSLFCTSKCGWTYRNRMKKENYNIRESEIKKLAKNAKILENFYNKDKKQIPINVLEFIGFDFDLCTTPVKYDKENGHGYYKMLDYWVILILDKQLVEI
jgi:hypothetical protein